MKEKSKKKILFVINTLGRAGAETALLTLLTRFTKGENKNKYEIYLYCITGQGELAAELPEGIKLLNTRYYNESVLAAEGRRRLKKTCIRALLKKANIIRFFPYEIQNLLEMAKRGEVKPDKLLWRILAESCERFEEHFDLAVAYLEGGSAYYVADHVSADVKAAFIHVDYEQAGYSRLLDKDCFKAYDRIFAISDDMRKVFLTMYPEYSYKTDVFHNIIDAERILSLSKEYRGFDDGFQGRRIVTVGRLTGQKAIDTSIEAMKIIKESIRNHDEKIKWYVIGDGEKRDQLEKIISDNELDDDFILLGAVDNPYPYIAQADIYVHASRFEGRSIAIQEAQVLSKAIIASDRSGNRDQIIDGVDGILCELNPESIADAVLGLIYDDDEISRLGNAASYRISDSSGQINKLTDLIK